METTDDLLLMALSLYGGSVSGKRLLQSQTYLVSQRLGLTFDFKADFAGPFSASLNASISKCIALGFIEEATEGFASGSLDGNVRKQKYCLTSDGVRISKHLEQGYQTSYEQGRTFYETLRGYPDRLKMAMAQVLFLQRSCNSSDRELMLAGTKMGWTIDELEFSKALECLQKAKLAKQVVECS